MLLALVTGVLSVNGYLLARGVDVPRYTAELIQSITADSWVALTRALARLAIAIVGLLLITTRRYDGAVGAYTKSHEEHEGSQTTAFSRRTA